MNKLLINALLKTGQLEAGKEYDLDFDHQYIETEKFVKILRIASSRIVG